MACTAGNTEMVRTLLEKGGKIGIRNNDGNIALHMAASNKNLKIVELLLLKRKFSGITPTNTSETKISKQIDESICS